MSDFELTYESSVRGFHVYKDVWSPILLEVLQTRQEPGNLEDEHAVAIIKESSSVEIIVGHVPRDISRICWYFLQNDGEITCEVTGSRRHSALLQGGMEIPCRYKFIGKKKHIKKLRTLLAKE